MMALQKLPREFYARNTELVARELLGKNLIYRADDCERIGKIVEVEAYVGIQDLASHSRRGITPRTKTMFGPPGYLYVYLIYGMYYCINVVTEPEDCGSAVLIRALQPIKNLTIRTQGPGLLARALHINKTLNGHDLTSDDLFIAADPAAAQFVTVARPRIGVAYAQEWADAPLRFYIQDNPYISRK